VKKTVHVVGSILRDADNERKRNYVNLILTLKADGEPLRHYHLINYAANANSVKHLLKISSSESREEMEKLYSEKNESKLARNRITYQTIDKEFDLDSDKEFVDTLSGAEMKVAIAKAKSFAGGLRSRVDEALAEREARKFDEREEDEGFLGHREIGADEELARISDDELLAKEASTTFGKATSETNKNWGMF
jgi:hypothetical protein